MNPDARLTIVIPARNRASVLRRTLDSVAAQSLRPLEVVLVDNGSTDDTLSMMQQWAAQPHGINAKVVCEPTPGAAAARNRGLQEVRTEWTMFFDSDDTMAPGHCRRALDAAARSGADIVGWNVRYVNCGSTQIKPFYVTDVQYHSLMHGSMSTQRYAARTELIRRVGGWNPAISYWDDIELGARLLALDPQICHAGKEITVDVYPGADGITGTRFCDHTPQALAALDAIRSTLGPKYGCYIDLKTIILAADCAREGSPDGSRLKRKVLEINASFWLRLAYLYQRAGGRGTARIFRMFLP